MSVKNFIAYNPTRLVFGAGSLEELGKYTLPFGKKALLLYGKGSVKKYGYYDLVVEQLRKNKIELVEYSGIKPNPVIEDVNNAAAIGRSEKVDVVIALGGGSVIDSAKITALSIASNCDGWDIIKRKVKPTGSLPLISILTLAATGTEMNAAAVVQNNETGEKIGFVNELMFPKVSILDPLFTKSVPADYTAYGIVDLIAHALEAFFGDGEPPVTDSITCQIIKDAMRWGPALLEDLENAELRSNIMLDATLALNGLTQFGKNGGDWGVHALGHELSLLYDLPHGATLSIAYIAWLKLHKDRIPERINQLGKYLFDAKSVDETINSLRDFFTVIGSPVNLIEAGIQKDQKQLIIEQMNKNKASGMNHELNDNDRSEIVELMFQAG